MASRLKTIGWLACLVVSASACAQAPAPTSALPNNVQVLFLHHSTGENIWNGGVAPWFEAYNASHRTNYTVTEQNFPKESPYGWENFPYDYWNIWVRHAGPRPWQEEPTLEMLTRRYGLIVFKHCFPVSNIEPDQGQADVASRDKRLENYQLQYAALKEKLRQFPHTRFLVWTGAAQVRSDIDPAAAQRARDFFTWVRQKWDEPGDNIFLFDFYALETDGGLYLKPEYAAGDAHPNEAFSRRVAPRFAQRIVDVLEGRGDSGSLTGGTISSDAVPAKVAQAKPLKQPVAKSAVTPSAKVAGSEEAWIFDDAEDSSRFARNWRQGATYVEEDNQHAIRFDFSAGREEDWGEYGVHRIVESRPLTTSHDISSYRYLAFRVNTDRPLDLTLKLVTLPNPRGDRYQPHFGFAAYVKTTGEGWQWVVLDLAALELGVEGAGAYEAAGSPTRPERLTLASFALHQRDANAVFLLDDVAFHRERPAGIPE